MGRCSVSWRILLRQLEFRQEEVEEERSDLYPELVRGRHRALAWPQEGPDGELAFPELPS